MSTNHSKQHAFKQHFHLMGIGGIGMSAFARLLKAYGHDVSGCDAQASDLTRALEREGIRVFLGHDASHVDGVDVLIATEAISKEHPEIVAARTSGVTVRPRMDVLGELLAAGPSVGVVGTHGKTTTTSMIGMALAGANLDPSVWVGGIIREWDSNARVGTGPFVAEVDESDPKFADIVVETAVVTNAEDDHIGTPERRQATYWSSVEEQHAAFARFARAAKRVLYCSDWPGLDTLLAGCEHLQSYGTRPDADYRAVNVERTPDGTRYTVTRRGEVLGAVTLPMPGEHNVLNSLAAIAVADLYGADFERVAAALGDFHGPGRRWEVVGEVGGALVVDDYAHNPSKVEAALDGARQTGRRVRVVFQPHRYLRTQQVWPRLAKSLMQADEVLLLDIAASNETPIPGVHATLIERKMREDGHDLVKYMPDRGEVVAYLRETAASNDLIVTMGAGDVWKLSRDLVGRVR